MDRSLAAQSHPRTNLAHICRGHHGRLAAKSRVTYLTGVFLFLALDVLMGVLNA